MLRLKLLLKQLVNTLTDKFPNICGIVQNINPKSGNKILGNDEKIIFGEPDFLEKIEHIILKINYRSFFQVNMNVTVKMYKFISEHISFGSKIIDAFSGVGSIGLFLTRNAKKVICIENNNSACENARYNMLINKISNCEILNAYVENILQDIVNREKIDTIVFDPPRKGLDRNIIDLLLNVTVPQIIYVSCEPATQARDLNLLKEKYEIVKMKAFDMFPQTHHIENVVILKCRNEL